jgi:hypothetical protein
MGKLQATNPYEYNKDGHADEVQPRLAKIRCQLKKCDYFTFHTLSIKNARPAKWANG